MDRGIHHFYTKIAEAYGVNAAILLENIYRCVKCNEADKKHFYDGHYWTYSSVREYTKLFPYISDKQARNALKKLEDKGLILTGNYADSLYDKTKWYTVTKMGKDVVECADKEFLESFR